MQTITPSPYRVSTITCNGSINTAVDMKLFFEHVNIVSDGIGFIYAEYKGVDVRGKHPRKKETKKTANESKKCFDNQVTVVYRLADGYMPNCKLFRNGNIHLTGIRKQEDGVRMMQLLVDEVHRIYNECTQNIVKDVECMKPCDFKIRMINSDFAVPYSIRRKVLHKLLISNVYKNVCDFQSGTYPGVKLQYFWNSHSKTKDGCCHCEDPCDEGKGTGHGNHQCKKVTVAIFESGKILITGANSFDQVNDAYHYICKVLEDNHGDVKKQPIIAT